MIKGLTKGQTEIKKFFDQKNYSSDNEHQISAFCRRLIDLKHRDSITSTSTLFDRAPILSHTPQIVKKKMQQKQITSQFINLGLGLRYN